MVKKARAGSGAEDGGDQQAGFDAHLDPWCAVRLIGGDEILFGFALVHPTTGGLGWLTSTAISSLDRKRRRAVTASGRRYRLGRRIEPEDIPGEGDEAWMAFDLLVNPDAEDTEAVPPISADPPADMRWVAARKMARHLGLAVPGRAPKEVEAFISEHLHVYLRRRAAAKLC